MEVLFLESRLNEIDRRLAPFYNQFTQRIDYLSFLVYLEKSMYSKKGEEIGVCFFEHNKLKASLWKEAV